MILDNIFREVIVPQPSRISTMTIAGSVSSKRPFSLGQGTGFSIFAKKKTRLFRQLDLFNDTVIAISTMQPYEISVIFKSRKFIKNICIHYISNFKFKLNEHIMKL